MAKARNYQDQILDEAMSKGKPVSIFLAKGVRMEGRVKMHDTFTILLETEKEQVLIYKRAITSLFPARLYHNLKQGGKEAPEKEANKQEPSAK